MTKSLLFCAWYQLQFCPTLGCPTRMVLELEGLLGAVCELSTYIISCSRGLKSFTLMHNLGEASCISIAIQQDFLKLH